jgi:ATP-dependent DNA helicase RecG
MLVENQNTEFKRIWKDEYLKSICAFANAQGGKLYIGIDNNGEIIGLKNYERLLEELPNKVRDVLGIIPEVNHRNKNGKDYIEIIVQPYNNPISFKGHFYYRVGSTIQDLNGPDLEKFLLAKKGKKWDAVITDSFTISDLSKNAFEIFQQKARLSKRIPSDDLSESKSKLIELLGLSENGKLTRAAILIFGKEPEKLVTGAFVKIGFFKTHINLLFYDEIHGSLLEQVEKTMELLLTKYLKANISYQGITRIETYDYPEEALREAILNAIIHKDYSSGNPVQISVYDEMLWISNSGSLPKGWTIKNLITKHKSVPQNPDIAKVFFRAGYIETWGRGTLNIIESCRKAGLPEPEFKVDDGVTVVFKKVDKSLDELAKINFVEKQGNETERILKEKYGINAGYLREKYGINAVKIFILIDENPYLSLPKIARQINVSLSTVEKLMHKLKKDELIKRIGSRKTGYWQIANNDTKQL